MRPHVTIFTLLALFPVPALACEVYNVPAKPLAYMWWSLPIFCIAGFIFRMVSDNQRSPVPVALAIMSVGASIVIGAAYGNGNWVLDESVLILPWLLPIAALLYGVRNKLVLTLLIGLVFSASAFGAHLNSFEREFRSYYVDPYVEF